jgi:hypothetical protein
MTVGSALDHCSLCMQKKKSLCAEFCSSRPAGEVSGIFWIMIEFTNLLTESIELQGYVGATLTHPRN